MNQSSPSNNFKERLEIIIGEGMGWVKYDDDRMSPYDGMWVERDGKAAHDISKAKFLDETINLILDTILASEEMQDEKLVKLHRSHDEDDDYNCVICKKAHTRNKFRADLRTMLEGMKS